ncbi:MAG: hypothetical protein C0599_16685 [Salinivirgaceae bacterium]|nr:MAG: hypothetical protein C0599_16685 [Salinivirgaceae bacterium]
MIYKHWLFGGPHFMTVIYILWVAVIALAIIILLGMSKKEEQRSRMIKLNNAILFLGSFALIFGLLGQGVGLYEAMEAIQRAHDISPAIMAGGFQVSMIAPLYGFGLLIISSIIWFVYRNILQK